MPAGRSATYECGAVVNPDTVISPIEDGTVMANAIFAATGRRLRLLPAGRVR
jgi:CO/xanthine dehydrogenase Mo-binding subunit